MKYSDGSLSLYGILPHHVPALIYTICMCPQHIIDLTLSFERDIDMDYVFYKFICRKFIICNNYFCSLQ